MLKCRAFYLPLEFSVVVIVAVYIPPQVNAKQALAPLYSVISKRQGDHPNRAFIIAGDFNHTDRICGALSLYQPVQCPTRDSLYL